jgi:hypothetical protein
LNDENFPQYFNEDLLKAMIAARGSDSDVAESKDAVSSRSFLQYPSSTRLLSEAPLSEAGAATAAVAISQPGKGRVLSSEADEKSAPRNATVSEKKPRWLKP